MNLTKDGWLAGAARRMGLGLLWTSALGLMVMALALAASAQAVSTTTVQGTVYLANGSPGAGTLDISWPAFTTAAGQSVAADYLMVTIGADGFLSVNLAPNAGATPAGLYYTAVYQMSDGSTSTQFWVVPAAAEASLAQVQAQLMPAAQAVQTVSKAYVDEAIAELEASGLTALGGTLTGPLYLSGDPTQPLQAADKHYVDETFSLAVPLAGGNMTGDLTTPGLNGVESPVAGTPQATVQSAMSAAGTTGAVEIPPIYAGTDGFTNPNGVYVADLRQRSSQQFERSVKEFGAVCDGTTDDTNALQAALNYADTHAVSLTIPQGTCKTRALNWHGESIGGLGKQVSALLGFPGQDVLAAGTDSTNLLAYTRIHDLTIYVDQSVDVSCTAAEGRAAAGSCAVSRPLEGNSIFSPGGNGLTGTAGTGAAWAVGNCAIAMPAVTGAGGNGLRVAEIENLEIATTGVDPMAAYTGAHSTHTCGLYLAQWPQWSEFRNIDIRGLNTGVAIPALPVATPAGLNADSNRWQNITIQATHGITAAAGSNNVLDNVVVMAGNSAATAEPPTGVVLDFAGTQQGWTVRNAVILPTWNAVNPQLTVTAAGGAVTAVTVGTEHGLGLDPYGTTVPLTFSGSCTAQATASVTTAGAIGTVSVTNGGTGCSGTTTASVNVAGNWDTAAPVNLIDGQDMTFFAGNLLKGNGGYTVWNAASSQSNGTQLDGGGGTLPGGGSYSALVLNNRLGSTYPVDQYPGANFGAKLQACLGTISASYGGTCDARNFTGTVSMTSNLTISTANTTVLLPCATISTANQVIVTAGTRNVTLRGCALRGSNASSGDLGGTVFLYSGTGAAIQVGDPTYAADTMGFHLDDAVVNTTTTSNATAQGLVAYRAQEMDLESLYFLGNSNQTGMTLDGTGNYTGGSFFGDEFNGFQTAVNAIGHQVTNPATTDWMNASEFVRLHIDCPTSGGIPISGTYGINLQQGDGNTFSGGDVEGCSTALHLGVNAQNNTIVGLRNENSTNQIVADTGSSYNNWMTGGTMFTGQLTDHGTRNSFLDTFHRSFNGMNGDWYGSQQDATVTNHYRLGIGLGNERGLQDRYQTDYGYRWTMGLSDATAGAQFYQILDELNSVYRLSIGQYNSGGSSTNNQTVVNAAGSGAVVINGSNNAGTGGLVLGSGGASETTVATINSAGNAQFNGTLQVGGTSAFLGTTTVKNHADAEIDSVLQAGLTTGQKESFIYNDWNGNSQWYMVKTATNDWALNSATGNLDSFKAYQSTNSGDTYINASNSSGVVRVNYETGAGTGFNVYGGSSSLLYASFTGTAAIRFPGLAASSGHNCVQVDNSGYITNTGSACGSGGGGGGSGTVNSGTTGQIAYYSGGGTTVSGLSTVPITAGGTGATTATGALTSLGGASLTTTSAQSFAGAVSAPSVAASVNQVLSVLSYGAKCDGATTDTTAIQAAFNAALPSAQGGLYTNGASVQFPAGVCKTGTIAWKGQSFFGAGGGISGQAVTTILGLPGQDVFQTPDASGSAIQNASVHDLLIEPDASTDVSSGTGGSGASAFAGRVFGTQGGASNALATPFAAGPMVFGGSSIGCTDSISASSTTFTASCASFANAPSWMVVGVPITIDGAGVSGANLTTTIASVVSNTQVTIATAASTTVSNVSGSWGNSNNPPWYCGNAGIALPDTSGSAEFAGINNYVLRNVFIQSVNGPTSGANHVCGIFAQTPPYGWVLDNVQTRNLYGGYIEAVPATNATTYEWTPDDQHVAWYSAAFDTIPYVAVNGQHRQFDKLSIYSNGTPFSLGPIALSVNIYSGAYDRFSATIDRLYWECYSYPGGEISRWMGTVNIAGGSLAQCGGVPGSYVNWMASDSTVNAQGGPPLTFSVGANGNKFTNTNISQTYITDNGYENSVETQLVSSNPTPVRQFYNSTVPPQEPVGKIDGSFLSTGNSSNPYLSNSDLVTTCRDWYGAVDSSNGFSCPGDPGEATNPFGSYLHSTTTNGFLNYYYSQNPLFVYGKRIPLTKVYAVTMGRCVGASTTCSSSLLIYDMTSSTSTNIGTCTLTFNSSWTMQGGPSSNNVCLVNMSAVPAGDVLGFSTNSFTGTGVTQYDIATLSFEPQNADASVEAKAYIQGSGLNLASGFSYEANGVPTTLTICSGTISIPATAIASGAKSAFTASCTGSATTDNVMVDFAGGTDPTTLTGFVPSTGGILTVVKWATANTVNVTIENNTSASITPTAFTLNFRVVR